MPEQKKTLFVPVVSAEKLNPSFKLLMDQPSYHPARTMLDHIYQGFIDLDANFLEQFQSTAFDARFFELYLFAYFSKSGFEIDLTYQRPDFLVTRNGLTVAVEATTANPSDAKHSERNVLPSELSQEEYSHYLANELPMKFGGPLYSKLNEEYWKLEQCEGKPLVLAIEGFFNEESLGFSENPISEYLYGQRQSADWTNDGVLEIQTESVESHTSGSKTIPSNFFEQPGAEHISAVVFTNSGTHAKFTRMGYQQGFGTDHFEVIRKGFCYTPDPNVKNASFFSYSLSQPPMVEWWGQGLVVNHNPNALLPLPKDFFHGAMQAYIEDGQYKADIPDWHPFVSQTVSLHFKKARSSPITVQRVLILPISEEEFRGVFPFDTNVMGITTEEGWFTDESESFLGVLFRDRIDQDWGYVILARDEHFIFRAIDTVHSMQTRETARQQLQLAIAGLALHGQRIFPQ